MNRGARILYVGTLHPHRGGTAMVANDLLPGLAARGHSITAVAPFVGEPPARWDAALRRAGVTVARFPMPRFETNVMVAPDPAYRSEQQAQARRVLAAVCQRNDHDVLMIGRESFVVGLPDLARASGMRVIAIVHSVASAILRGQVCAEAFPNMVEELSKCDRMVSVSEQVGVALVEVGLADVWTICSGIDVESFRPGAVSPRVRRHLSPPADATLVGHVSNLNPVKRVPDFIAAAAIARRQRPDLHFVVLGDGPDRSGLEQETARRGLAEHIRFHGWIERQELPGYYRALDIVVLPSSIEGLPLAGLEAMASGCVLIASDIPASRELIIDGRAGMLFPTGDVEALARCVLRAAARPELRREIGGNARRHVAERYTRERMVDGYDRMLDELARSAP
jgi:glycosyltransferase involved in cell wall biosynthesis